MEPLEGSRRAADRRSVLERLRKEEGWGLMELLLALTILNIGVLAIVASMNSTAVALKRASKISTAAALADAQMEQYRALTYAAIELDDYTTKNTTDSVYRSDPVLGGDVNTSVTSTTDCAGVPIHCNPSRTATGADRRPYRIDTYVTMTTPTSGRPVKLVTIVVRDGAAPYGRLNRQQSTFDESTGL
jgi:type II secretory pathway pseudopilin PulG